MFNLTPVWNCEEIIRSNLIVVEGRDDENLLGCLIDDMGLMSIQVMRIGGESAYTAKIRTITITPGFDIVRVLGLVRDADLDPHAKFESICNAVRQVGFDVPTTVSVRTGSDPEVCIFVVPSLNRPGKIETCCLESVENNPALPCVDQYISCLSNNNYNPRNIEKAKLHAYIASRDDPSSKLGEAARNGYFDFAHETFDDIKNFLQIMIS